MPPRPRARTLLCCACLLAPLAAAGEGPPPPGTVLILAEPAAAAAWTLSPPTLSDLLPDQPGSSAPIRPLLRDPAGDPPLAAELGLDRVFVAECPPESDPGDLASALGACNDIIEGAWVDRIAQLHSADESGPSPNDQYFPVQYSLRNVGQAVDGVAGLPGADINVLDAWGETIGSADIKVAVLDAGISRSHPDLLDKLVPGWNCLEHNYDTDDEHTSHGTHVAGIIAATTGNRAGIAGIGWRTRLMPIVVVNRYGFGSESVLAEGLIWAADRGARVASVSLGFNPTDGSDEDTVLRAAVQYATQRGVLICASSGNTPGARIGAPARYPEVVAVGATNNRDQLWSSTSIGPEMDLVAPGVAIWSTWDSVRQGEGENTYAPKTGTSQACPHVAGVAALVLATAPSLIPAEVKTILEQTAADLGQPGRDPSFGAGRLDAGAAVLEAATRRPPGESAGRCTADFNGDDRVDSRDLVAFLDAFAQGSRRADIAEPFGTLDTRDLIAFLVAHAAGCDS